MSCKHVFQAIIEQDEASHFVAECPALKACYTQGRTYEEAIENIKEVIELCLADRKTTTLLSGEPTPIGGHSDRHR